jgi:hypothetical protein
LNGLFIVTILLTKIFNRTCLILVAVAGSFSTLFSQDQSIPVIAHELWFDQLVGVENSGVINGRQYRMELRGGSSNPFFGAGEAKGIVLYNNQKYYVPLLYDIFKDELIVKHLSTAGLAWFVQLDKKLVQEFSMSGRLFRKFGSGFYEVIFEGEHLLVLAKRSRIGQTQKGIFNYIDDDRFFLVNAGKREPLRSLLGFERVLDDKEEKKAFRAFVRERKIKVRKFRNEDLASVGKFLNELRNKKQQ